MSEEQYLTIREAAQRLRRNPKTIWRWTLDNKIAYHQPYPNAKILIPLSAIFKVLKEQGNGK